MDRQRALLLPWIPLAATLACHPLGARAIQPGSTPPPVVSFSAPDCTIDPGIGKRASELTFSMVHGRKDFSLLVMTPRNEGYEVESHQLEAGIHTFSVRNSKFVWQYSFPDRAGAPGQLQKFPLAPGTHAPRPDQQPSEVCALVATTTFPQATAATLAPAPEVETSPTAPEPEGAPSPPPVKEETPDEGAQAGPSTDPPTTMSPSSPTDGEGGAR